MRPVLLIAYDLPYPEPLRAPWSIPDAVAVAILLAAVHGGRVSCRLAAGKPDDHGFRLPRELAQNMASAAIAGPNCTW